MYQMLELINLEGIMAMCIMLFHIIISLACYLKMRRWILILTNFLFSVILGFASFQYYIPLAPYIQIFDIMINVFLLIMVSVEAYNK